MGKMGKEGSFVFPPITKSDSDAREYRGIRLANDLKVLLISDPATDKSAACMSVAAGSMNDPIELPGLAHFCEHMLFLGTKKYPVENDYVKFISEHGGSYNAYTTSDHTAYHFDVSPKHLEQLLDRFSQFFVSPLFTESATEREVNAVNSENERKIPHDCCRLYQLEKSTADSNHPHSNFGTGNLETLWENPRRNGINVYEALLKFHKEYYSANALNLVILGVEPLDELQSMAEEMFSEIENRNIQIPHWPTNPYGKNELQTKIEVVPINDIRQLELIFPIPDTTNDFKTLVGDYLTHLIGHQGPGSLLSLLKGKNWVNSLWAFPYSPSRGFALFSVGLDLSEEGLEHVNCIVGHIFQYINMLQKCGSQKWVWDENRVLSEINFRLKDKEKPQDFVTNLSTKMILYPMEDVLTAECVFSSYKPELITSVLNALNPDNVRITIVSKNFESHTKYTEKFYGVKYNIEDISSSVIQEWKNCGLNDNLQFPPRNVFIPSEFELKPRTDNTGIVPKIIHDSQLSRIWFLQDNEFMLPKACVRVQLYSPWPMSDPGQYNLNSMFADLLRDVLTEQLYAATIAGLDYSIGSNIYGVYIYVNGYDHKLGVLLERILKELVGLSIKEKRFRELLDRYSRSLKNWDNGEPYYQSYEYVENLLREKNFSKKELLLEIKGVSFGKIKEYAKRFLSRLKFEWLFLGNITSDEALSMAKSCEELFKEVGTTILLPCQSTLLREIELPAVYFQVGMLDTKLNVCVDMLEQILSEPCFDELRTKQQLGYTVYSTIRNFKGSKGIGFCVQGDRHPVTVEERIDSFLEKQENVVMNMSEEEFIQHRESLAAKKAEKPKTMSGRCDIIWEEIAERQYEFERQANELEELEKVQLCDVQQLYKRVLGTNSDEKRRLSIHIVSMAEGGAGRKPENESLVGKNKESITNITEWKVQRKLYPSEKIYQSPTSATL